MSSPLEPESRRPGDKAVEDLGSSRHNLWNNYTGVTTTSSRNSRGVVEGSQAEFRCVAKKNICQLLVRGWYSKTLTGVERRAIQPIEIDDRRYYIGSVCLGGNLASDRPEALPWQDRDHFI